VSFFKKFQRILKADSLLDKKDSQIQELESKLLKKEESIQENEEKLHQLKSTKSKLTHSLKDVEEKENENSHLENQLSIIKEENSITQEQFKTDLETLRSELKEEKRKNTERQLSTNKQRSLDWHRTNEYAKLTLFLESKKSSAHNKLQALENELVSAKKIIQEGTESKRELKQLLLQKTGLVNEVEQSLIKIEGINSEISGLTAEKDRKIMVLMKEVEKVRTDCSMEITELKNNCKSELDDLQSSHDEGTSKFRSDIKKFEAKAEGLRSLEKQLESLSSKKSQTQDQLNQLLVDKADIIVQSILKLDLENGYVSQWAPQLVKRWHQQDPTAASSWLLEVKARLPADTNLNFNLTPTQLGHQSTAIEELFAQIPEERLAILEGRWREISQLEEYLKVWERYASLKA
jgi:myosin heavy subunit